MNRLGVVMAMLAAGLAGSALASSAPKSSLRPLERPVPVVAMASIAPDMSVLVPAVMVSQTRPKTRPVSPQAIAFVARPDTPYLGPEQSLRPAFRPESVVQQALFGKRKKRKGSVCGDIDVQGEVVGDYGKSGGGCFIEDAVRVKSVSDVRLSQPSLMNCDTAKALKKWVDKGVQPAFKRQGPVVELKVAAHYACRTRNNQKGAKLSEHAKGRAIDISGFVMRSGHTVTVLEDWNKGRDGKSLEKVHKAACGPFGTVLGPRSDRHHRDHFHFDTAKYRSGTYCK